MITQRIKQRLEQLDLNPHDSLIVGSSILAALEIRPSRDIDIMIDRPAFDRLATIHPDALTRYADGTGRLLFDDVEVMYAWNHKTIDDFKARAVMIDGLSFLSLADLIDWKRQQNRPKDQRDIQLIETYQAVMTTPRRRP